MCKLNLVLNGRDMQTFSFVPLMIFHCIFSKYIVEAWAFERCEDAADV
jgi:hypothetical protein